MLNTVERLELISVHCIIELPPSSLEYTDVTNHW